MMLAHLCIALRLRHRHRLRLRDLRTASAAGRDAVECTPPGSPELAPRLAGVADVMREQYLADGRLTAWTVP